MSPDPPRPDRLLIAILLAAPLRSAGADPLEWLPATLPSNCSLLLSTPSDAPVYAALAKRGWAEPTRQVLVPKLTADDKQQLASEVLQLHHKTLEPHLLIMLAKAKQTTVPLFLHMVLEELMANAVFETVDGMLRHCLAQPSATDLARLVLERLEAQVSAR